MLEELVEFTAAAAADIGIAKAAKRKLWVRVMPAFGSLVLLGLLIGVIYITVNFS